MENQGKSTILRCQSNGPIVLCFLWSFLMHASPPGVPCGPGSSNNIPGPVSSGHRVIEPVPKPLCYKFSTQYTSFTTMKVSLPKRNHLERAFCHGFREKFAAIAQTQFALSKGSGFMQVVKMIIVLVVVQRNQQYRPSSSVAGYQGPCSALNSVCLAPRSSSLPLEVWFYPPS